jgi:hypothetical protein
MIFTKYRIEDGEVLGILRLNSEVEAEASCLNGEAVIEGYADQTYQMVRDGIVCQKPQDVINAYKLQKATQDARSIRSVRLAACDWTQVADAPVDREAWAAYRQALRDVTLQDGFPLNIIWPNPPES